jgi:hypothetical protein
MSDDACGCMGRVGTMLAERNTRLKATFVREGNALVSRPYIGTEQIETGRGKQKATSIIPNYCPFCGVKYVQPEAKLTG